MQIYPNYSLVTRHVCLFVYLRLPCVMIGRRHLVTRIANRKLYKLLKLFRAAGKRDISSGENLSFIHV